MSPNKKIELMMAASSLPRDQFAAQIGMTSQCLDDYLIKPFLLFNDDQIIGRCAWIFGPKNFLDDNERFPPLKALKENFERWTVRCLERAKKQQFHIYLSYEAWIATKVSVSIDGEATYVCPECQAHNWTSHFCDRCWFEFALNDHKRVGHPSIKAEAYYLDPDGVTTCECFRFATLAEQKTP
jgi:hypothetical protein